MRLRELQATLERVFGLESLRPQQLSVIGLLADGRSVLALLPTGGGKSLCYQLPALHFEGTTIVVSPLLSLMKDQADSCRAKGIAAARIDSTMSRREVSEVLAAVRSGAVKLLYVSPERCASDGFRRAMRGVRIPLLAVDEAHTMSAWGTNFRPELLRLPEIARNLGAERILALTATATPEVVEDISAAFGIEHRVVTSFHRPNLELDLRSVRASDRFDELLRIRMRGPAIVYATYQKTCEELAARLRANGRKAEAYHAGQPSRERERIQRWFAASRDGIVCSTIAFGMGIDKADIRHVVHYNLPQSIEGYSQEIGRAGRDGRPSVCTLFATYDDVAALKNFAYLTTPIRGSLAHVVVALFDRGDRFRLDTGLVAKATGLDSAVLRTILWQLERGGFLREGRTGRGLYRVELRASEVAIVSRATDTDRELVEGILGEIEPDGAERVLDAPQAARRLGSTAERIAAVLAGLAASRLIGLESLEGRHEITIVARPDSPDRLVSELEAFFRQVERRDAERVDEVVGFLTNPGCHTTRLLAHFGERLAEPCGHCTFCLTGAAVYPKSRGKLPRLPPRAYFEGFRAAHPEPLADPRAAARFLFGFRSRELEAADLTVHPAFGLLRRHDFDRVREWLSEPTMAREPAHMFEDYAGGARNGVERKRKFAASLEAARATRRRPS